MHDTRTPMSVGPRRAHPIRTAMGWVVAVVAAGLTGLTAFGAYEAATAVYDKASGVLQVRWN